MSLIPPDSLHLQPEESTRCNVSSEHFDCLEVWKWSEKIERLRPIAGRPQFSPGSLRVRDPPCEQAHLLAARPQPNPPPRIAPPIAREVPGAAPTATCRPHAYRMPLSDTSALAPVS